jgi:hypothetical protein
MIKLGSCQVGGLHLTDSNEKNELAIASKKFNETVH